MGGFVVIRREALDHHIVGEPQRFYAWAWLISTACWKPKKFNIKGKTITLKRGQLCASRQQMADAWGWSPSAVERFLTRLQTEQMIGRETGQGRSIITIENYGKYQAAPKESGQVSGQVSGQQSDSNRTAKEQGNKGTSKSKDLQPACVSDKVWLDFQALRKAKRAPLTQTALNGIEREALKAGWTLEDALAECSARGWQAFKASWVTEEKNDNRRHGNSNSNTAMLALRKLGMAGD